MKCKICSRKFKPGQMAMPLHKVIDWTRYEPSPGGPSAWVHFECIAAKPEVK